MPQKATRVLLTGCSSGIGLALAVRLAKDEFKRFKSHPVPSTEILLALENDAVVAMMRDLEKREHLERAAGDTLNNTLEIKELDARCERSISECINSLPDRRVDVLVNNAGVGVIGPLECQSIAAMQELFDTNFFGLARLVREVLPGMKERRNGRIVGFCSTMYVYAASKFAVEGFCESLAVQAMKFDIKMTLVEPGPVVTEFERKLYEEAEKMDLSGADEETAQIFRKIYLPYSRKIFTSLGQTPAEVAEQTLNLITAKEPPLRHQTNRLYMPMTALKHADPTGCFPLDTFYKMTFSHDRVFTATLGLLRMLRKWPGKT